MASRHRSSTEQPSDFEPTAVLTDLDFDTEFGIPPVPPSTLNATLSPSVLMDLKRYAATPEAADLLVVVAAAMRHGQLLQIQVELDGLQLPLLLEPRRQLFRCPMDLSGLGDGALSRLRLVSVGAGPGGEIPGTDMRNGLLRPLAWHLAMRGERTELLPELTGAVKCRVTQGIAIGGMQVDGSSKRVIERMKFVPLSIDELVASTQLSRTMIQRLWNAMYLQSALMVTRTFPQ